MSGEFGKALRERRTAMDLSRSRLAAETGTTVPLVGRWERGEADPDPAQLAALCRLLHLSSAEAEIWRALLQPASSNGTAGLPVVPPADRQVVRHLPPVSEQIPTRPAASRPPVALPDEEGAGRARRRFEGLLSRGNTGAIFPIPARPGRVYTYGDGAPTYDEDRWRYRVRTVLLLVALGVMAGLLVWAIGELGEGLSAVVDLFRSPSPPALLDAFGSVPLG